MYPFANAALKGGNVGTDDFEKLRHTYSQMSEEKIRELYQTGPAGFGNREIWDLVVAEYDARDFTVDADDGAAAEIEYIEEGFFYDDDLPQSDPDGFACLKQYCQTHRSASSSRRYADLTLTSRREFMNKRLWPAIQGGTLIVGYNLAFDLTRLAVGVVAARGQMFDGGFSIPLFDYQATDGSWEVSKYRPWLRIKPLDGRRTLMGFASRRGASGPERWAGPNAYGKLLDLRHLTFALTDKKLSLARSAEAFGLPVEKSAVEEHGVISEAYIDYNRRDVEVTAALLEALKVEWDRHPVALSPDRVMSLRQAWPRAISAHLG